jgi:predicted nicotinamide N-methyase
MNIPATIQSFRFANNTVQLYVPSSEWVQEQFEKEGSNAPAPYWAQVWPAAKALCEVIASQPQLVQDKTVLEIAAGLGLPSLLAAQFAKEVTASDYMEDAVQLIQRSATYNKIKNIQCRVMDWNTPDRKIAPGVLLLSDISYEPESFDTLYHVLASFLNEGTTILLSTPQRLVAKSFMSRLQPWCRQTHNIEIIHNEAAIPTSVWLLQQ